MADRLTAQKIPTAFNLLGFGLPQAAENVRTNRQNQMLDLQESQAADARRQQADRLKPSLSPFGAETAGQVGGMLTSGIPALEAQGAQTLAALQRQRQSPEFQKQMLGPMQREQLTTEQSRQDLIAQQITQSEQAVALSQARMADLDRGFQQANAQNRLQLENIYRDDFTAAFTDVGETLLAYEQADRLIASGDAVGAQLAITKLAKLADPGSTVRVEEGKMVAEGTGLAERIATEFNKAKGKGFSVEATRQFRQAMRDIAEPTAAGGQAILQNYVGLAAKHGIDLDAIVANSGVSGELLAKLAIGHANFRNRGNIEFSDLASDGGSGVIQRAP